MVFFHFSFIREYSYCPVCFSTPTAWVLRSTPFHAPFESATMDLLVIASSALWASHLTKLCWHALPLQLMTVIIQRDEVLRRYWWASVRSLEESASEQCWTTSNAGARILRGYFCCSGPWQQASGACVQPWCPDEPAISVLILQRNHPPWMSTRRGNDQTRRCVLHASSFAGLS